MPVDFPAAPESVPPPGLYSHLSVARGEIIVLAGQMGRDPSGDIVGRGDIAKQAKQAFRNIGELLKAVQLDWSAVASFRTYIVGESNLAAYRTVRESVYADIYADGHYPPNTLLVVAALGRDDALVEIEALAVR
jgi:enamine deaminase RidA (YjgF/YER057c/UK114 family)